MESARQVFLVAIEAKGKWEDAYSQLDSRVYIQKAEIVA